MSIRYLDALPSLGKIYAQAGTEALKKRPKKVSADSLPSDGLGVRGVTISRETVNAVNRHVGAPTRDSVPSIVVFGTAFPLLIELMRQPEFPLPMLGMIHLTNTVEHHRTIVPGEKLTFEVRPLSLDAHHAGVACEIETRVLDDGGDVVWTGTGVFLAKGVTLEDAQKPERPEREAPDLPQMNAQWSFAPGEGRRWAGILGDYNPIHLSNVSAKLLGMKTAIVHGADLAAHALAAVEPADATACGGYEWHIEFGAPVPIPSRISFNQTAVKNADFGEGNTGEEVEGLVGFTGFSTRKKPRIHFTGYVRPLGV
ncbi:MaoC/PaaZ C-terminal domain-containing protein [Arthrobacter sp. HMSC08H08]|uniref:MaoC/PaaZ C-terminal domain-containing protein n=1 Tax=Arthrobacter sp. HMSC08H08 TaxID=1581143 RepID=UPI0008D2AA37|nr:MaoC/PaaZ C-terminal domain-containing protein [Arthrobacter sp. HMSC08H08]OFT23803.1 hypothetical protein HMPREF3175_02925 [Arthrobacter sp. HMSC08H08]